MSEVGVPKRAGLDSGVVRRLVVYLAGVAIGFGLLGYFQARSSREAAQRDAAAAAAETPGEGQQAAPPAEGGPSEAETPGPSNP